jgi:ParB family chromosome partitioning protein
MQDSSAFQYIAIDQIHESRTNPRQTFEQNKLEELAESIRQHGLIQPITIRPNASGFEIVAGARRFRAAQLAELFSLPARIVELDDAAAMEWQLVENLQRRDVHPMEEANGFRALLNLEEPKYSIEQIAAKTGKSPAYVAARLRLTELSQIVVDAFYREEIGVGHALLLAKLQPAQQEQALAACFKEDWSAGGQKAKRILLPVRSLHFWIETNVLLILKLAPFDKRDAQLVPAAGSCVDCPKRTGHNKLLFLDMGKQDACTDPTCYQAKVDAHVAKTLAAKPKLVQISTSYGQQKEGSVTLPRNKYVEVRPDKPTKEEATRPEFKTCKFTTEAIVSEGIDKGELRKVCTEPTCPMHHPKPRSQKVADDPKAKAQEERQRREVAIANTTGIRTLTAIAEAVPVRLMKRDLLFVAERLASLLDENRLSIIARRYGIKKAKDTDSLGKLFAAYLRRAEESVLGSVLVETTILYMSTRHNPAQVLNEAATVYKVDTDAIALKVKQEFAAKEKAKKAAQPAAKVAKKAA